MNSGGRFTARFACRQHDVRMQQTQAHSPGRDRDPFIDVIRALCVLAVISQHWLMPVLAYENGHLSTGNALASPGWWIVTWLTQVMPMVFFAGGAANFFSFRPTKSTRVWLRSRIARLLVPVVPLAAVWLLLPHVLIGAGVPEQPVLLAGRIAGQLLWFLAVYVLVVALTPVMYQWYRRYGWRVVGVLAVCALVVDVLRFEAGPAIGFVNALFVWLAVHQIGFHYADGGLRVRSGRPSAGLAAVGFGLTAAAVFFGPYPASMIGMPGAPVSNMSPPTALMLSLAVGQLGLWLTLKPVITRLAGRPSAAAVLRWCGTRFMTLYLWHMPALVMTAGIAIVGLGFSTPTPGSPMWFAVAPLWIGVSGIFLMCFTGVFGRFEFRRRSGTASEMGPGRIALAAVLSAGGLLGLAAQGFVFPGNPLAPVLWVALVLTGLLVVRERTVPEAVAGQGARIVPVQLGVRHEDAGDGNVRGEDSRTGSAGDEDVRTGNVRDGDVRAEDSRTGNVRAEDVPVLARHGSG
ncbi:acyltransferase [Streptomyces sp. sk2.1]|uniref:acyltransferase family protein n=1 Tax=Streptomyces sp. sk2.1 TaxID=2478959 RepID=UPI00292A3CF1|nr:acyltransferase [Streptomyces sp. sk2.1]